MRKPISWKRVIVTDGGMHLRQSRWSDRIALQPEFAAGQLLRCPDTSYAFAPTEVETNDDRMNRPFCLVTAPLISVSFDFGNAGSVPHQEH